MRDRNLFNRWAADYDQDVIETDERGAFPFAGYRAVLEHIYDAVQSGGRARVLDLGVGTGVLAKALYDAGHEMTAIDFSPEMLAIARAKMPNARLYEWDFANNLPDELVGGQFDFMISTYALHHLTDADKIALLRRLKPSLRAGGAVLIGDIMFETANALRACRADAEDEFDDGEYYAVYETLRPMLEADWAAEFEAFSKCAGLLTLRANG